jgi:hypothetical protein
MLDCNSLMSWCSARLFRADVVANQRVVSRVEVSKQQVSVAEVTRSLPWSTSYPQPTCDALQVELPPQRTPSTTPSLTTTIAHATVNTKRVKLEATEEVAIVQDSSREGTAPPYPTGQLRP